MGKRDFRWREPKKKSKKSAGKATISEVLPSSMTVEVVTPKKKKSAWIEEEAEKEE